MTDPERQPGSFDPSPAGLSLPNDETTQESPVPDPSQPVQPRTLCTACGFAVVGEHTDQECRDLQDIAAQRAAEWWED